MGLLQALLQLSQKFALLPKRQAGEVAHCLHGLRGEGGSLLLDSLFDPLDLYSCLRDSVSRGLLTVINFT